MYLLRLHRVLTAHWRGTRYVRGHVYDVDDHDLFLAMLESGLFQEVLVKGPNVSGPVGARNSEVVVIRHGGLGDVLMALPSAQEFARRHPEIRVTFATATQYVDLLAAQPGLAAVCSIHEIPAGANRIDLSNYPEQHRDNRHTPRQVLFAQSFGLALEPAEILKLRLPLVVEKVWTEKALHFLREAGWSPGQPLVAITRSGTDPRRAFSPAQVEEIARLLQAAGVRVVLLDTTFGKNSGCRLVSLAGLLSVAELAGAISLCHVLVGPDTGTIHLAAHIGIPVVAMFTDWRARLRVSSYDAIAFEPEHTRRPLDPKDVVAACAYLLRRKFPIAIGGDAGGFLRRAVIFGDL